MTVLSPHLLPAGVREALIADTAGLDSLDAWPHRSLQCLARHSLLGAAIPAEFGGRPLSPVESVEWHVALSEACLVTAFVLSQRDAACHRIALSSNSELKSSLFPRLARGDAFATVGISHLSTSRQHCGTPAVRVMPTDDGYRLDGSIPWVSGARYADEIVVGGTLADGTQILGLTPRTAPGLAVGPSQELMALSSSHTASIELRNVFVPNDRILAGPVAGVMKQGPAGTGSLTTSALAVGSASSSVSRLLEEASRRPDLEPIAAALAMERDEIFHDMREAAAWDAIPPKTIEQLRQRANSLVLRAAQASLAACKGAGYVRGHPAERCVREAMFFLVWSCPQPVVSAALREFACVDGLT